MITDAATSPTNSPAAQSLVGRCWEVLLILMVFFILAGEPAPHVNESHYLSRLKHYWDPGWCTGDLFLESPEAHLVFAWTLGWMTKWLSLPAFAWVGRTLAWSLLAWAWQRLSWRVVPAPLAAVLSAALWVTLNRRADLAGEWMVGGVEAKCFAYVFVLVALRELVDGRWNRVWLALGAASAFHVLVGGWSVVVCGGIWLVEQFRRSDDQRPTVSSAIAMLPGLVGGGLLALAGVMPALALTWNESPTIVAEANRIYVFERLPHHLALLSLPTEEVVRHFTRHCMLILALVALVQINRRVTPRSNDALRLVTCYAWGAVLLATVGLVLELAFWNSPHAAAGLLRFYWFRLTDVAVPLAVALQSISIITAGLAARRAWAVWALVVALLLTCGNVAVATRNYVANPIPPADSRIRDYDAWVDVCDWVAANTPPDALFITPRRNQTFKWRTSRAEVATHKDIPQDARSMVEWFDRLSTIYYEEVDGEQVPALSLSRIGTERIVASARKYGAGYVLADNRVPLDLPIVYPNGENANDEYVVYRVDP